jgi:predicted RNase H-like nuclease (RuvC/YqgF family)
LLFQNLMNSKVLNTMLVVFLIIAGFAIYEALKPAEPFSTSQAIVPISMPRPKAPVVATITEAQTSIPRAAVETAAPQPQTQELQQQLQRQAQKISQLKAQQQQQLQQMNVNNPWWLTQRQQDIENLIDQLADQRETMSQIARSLASAQNDQSLQLKAQQDQLDLAIQQTAEGIQQLQVQMYSGLPLGIVTLTEQQDYYARLQNTLTAYNDQLDALRVQRIQLSAAAANQSAGQQASVQQQQQDLLDSQQDLQNQITAARNDVRSIQNSNQELRMSLVPLGQQIEQAEKDYQALQDQLKNSEPIAR